MKLLNLVPENLLVRLLRVLDHQFHQVEGLSVDECEHSDTNAMSSVSYTLESVHATLVSLNKLYRDAMGISNGLVIGYYLFINVQPTNVQDLIVHSLVESNSKTPQCLLPNTPW
ncbi:hypothetical protein PVL29_009712 [Vitis rotundifolia]|uniref:Uncharacterized protein n=1 Tax=Vitis rotundifolia TaxID=103349 RepID=A0AA38ZRC9_VITRO|nr:hypothetical protein PVL29_009712 [Vitis rotundifolia]